jgi:quinoprotein glucose dehydrogenase
VIYVVRGYASILLFWGFALAGGGVYLLTLHGSSYYLLYGIAVVVSALLLWRQRGAGAVLYGLSLLMTITWALREDGIDTWALLPRVFSPLVLGIPLLLSEVRRSLVWRYRRPSLACVLIGILVAVLAGLALRQILPPSIPVDPLLQAGVGDNADEINALPRPRTARLDWPVYGGDSGGTRYSPLTQITPANVGRLELAWVADIGTSSSDLEATPVLIDRTIYLCNGTNSVIALDAESGKQIWRHDAGARATTIGPAACRGVAYYRIAGASGACAERIFTTAYFGRLIALDARDGTPCKSFGIDGEVSLLDGLGEVPRDYYSVTSAPTIIQNQVVLGSNVRDWQYWGEPSGVIRAYDVVTGKLSWAWDMGHPDWSGAPPPGEIYTPSTPNSWGPMSTDETLGLVYVPTGNTSGSDYFGGLRRPYDDKYSSSVVALDASTGKPRWSFQVVHHDLWDYDVPAQPTLVDYSTSHGVVHALVQPTKSGEVFVLDRATGAPIYPVEEHPAPQIGKAANDPIATSQPYSVGLPSFRGPDLVEDDMWGLTPLDELWCRIKFRQARYEGPYTPPGVTASVQMPGSLGGMEWGGAAVDVERDIVVVNSNHIANYVRLLPRDEADKLGLKRFDATAKRALSATASQLRGMAPQEGTPYGVQWRRFLSPLWVPCTRPPYGRLSAFSLRTGHLLWSQSFGIAHDLGALGMASHLPLPIGVPNFGGGIVTQSGLLFIGATLDRQFRAYETTTGELLWRTQLPNSGTATPMTYLSPESGRQFVVIASGPRQLPFVVSKPGNAILAFTLPKAEIASP